MRSPPKSLIDHMCVIVEEVGSEPFTSRDLSTPGTRNMLAHLRRRGYVQMVSPARQDGAGRWTIPTVWRATLIGLREGSRWQR
jgi:hypothetical protein